MKLCMSLNHPSCRYAGAEPDDDLCCYHPSAPHLDARFGTYARHVRKEGAACGPEGKLWERHENRPGHDKPELEA